MKVWFEALNSAVVKWLGCRRSPEGHKFKSGLEPSGDRKTLSSHQSMGACFESGKDKAAKGKAGPDFHILCQIQ